jgi:nucleotide-binding universal stress UspA family protein
MTGQLASQAYTHGSEHQKAAPAIGDFYLVVGYDGSPPAGRALDAAVILLQGRTGRVNVVYVAHVPTATMLSTSALAEIESTFDDIEQELRAAADERLRSRVDSWGFERRRGLVAEELLAAARETRADHPDDTVVIVVGSSSHAMHRVVGSAAVSLARHSPVPLVIVP